MLREPTPDMCTLGRVLNDIRSDSTRAWVLKGTGFKFLDQGSYKRVYLDPTGTFVVKLLGGYEGTSEIGNYENAPESIKPLLVPVLLHNAGQWQIQEYVKPHSCADNYCRVLGVSDSGSQNHTHTETGEIRIFDYGQSCQWYPE